MRAQNTTGVTTPVATVQLNDAIELSQHYLYRLIPCPLWDHMESKGLRPAAKQVYLELLHDATLNRSRRQDFFSDLSASSLAHRLSLSESAVKKALRELADTRLIVRTRRRRPGQSDLPALTHFTLPPDQTLSRHRRIKTPSSSPSPSPTPPQKPSVAPAQPPAPAAESQLTPTPEVDPPLAEEPQPSSSPASPNPSSAPSVEELRDQLAELSKRLEAAAEAKDLTAFNRLATTHSRLTRELANLEKPDDSIERESALSLRQRLRQNAAEALAQQESLRPSKEVASTTAMRCDSTVSDALSAPIQPPPSSSSTPAHSACVAPAQPHQSAATSRQHPGAQRLSRAWIAALQRKVSAIPTVSCPEEVWRQIQYQVEEGVYSRMPVRKAVNICLSLVKKNQWRTPIGCPPVKKNEGRHPERGGCTNVA